MVQLAQRIAVHYHLAPLTEKETELYIQHRLEVASGEGDTKNIFTEDALEVIFQHTQGTPRLINLLCDACLVYAYADEVNVITGAIVEETVKSQEESGFFLQSALQANRWMSRGCGFWKPRFGSYRAVC
jgi:hypothetical protein